MADMSIYKDIAERTGGDIYIGVVGPVRTGKSTLIKRFISDLAIPNIQGEFMKERARDEMPQSASGKTVMTTEPKFVPEEAVHISIDGNAGFDLRMIDCVGYIVPDALGHYEDGEPRMVMTPWSDTAMPFERAAELGTQKVITEHSTIGLLVTADGTFGEIPRESYIEAEKRVAAEMTAINKPFVVVLNSARPTEPQTEALAKELEAGYGVPVIPVNCLTMGEKEIKRILAEVLYEFPVREVTFATPSWAEALEDSHALKSRLLDVMNTFAQSVVKVGDVYPNTALVRLDDLGVSSAIDTISLGSGSVKLNVNIPDRIFYGILGEKSGFEINGEGDLLDILTRLAEVRKKYEKVAEALDEAERTGYGIVTPTVGDLTLEEPEIVKQAGGYGVRLKASAPSIHMVRVPIRSEVSPIVGTERQSEELVQFLLKEFEEDPQKLWESNMFGKTLHELVSEGLTAKLGHMPEDARTKISETLEKIINEGSGGLICILL